MNYSAGIALYALYKFMTYLLTYLLIQRRKQINGLLQEGFSRKH